MGQALLLTLLFSYKAILGDLLLGIVPSDIDKSINLNQSYSLDESNEKHVGFLVEKDLELVAPVIDASSSIVVDLASDKVLFAKDVYQRRQIASLTKLMTALLVIENANLNDEVVVSQNAASILGSNMGLYGGEKLTVESLLYGMLINSANDAALALAEHTFGSENAFVIEMNKKVTDLGLVNTKFNNSVGLDSQGNYSTAFEVYLLTKEFLKYPLLRRIVSLDEFVVTNTNKKEHKLSNTNKNLKSEFDIIGVKTGTTDMAGQSLVNLFRVEEGYETVVVLLDSPRRFEEARILSEWVDRAYNWKNI
jgi:D-alanyl-D-alanine carboxypeptidase